VRADPALTYETAAQNLAAQNTYVDSDPETQVLVGLCNGPALATDDGLSFGCVGLPAGENPADFIHVHIKSVVHLTFARVVGWETMINHTDAISRATEPTTTNWFDGYAIAALHEGCQSPGDGDPFQLGGNADVNIVGAGVLVNANCPTQDSLVQSGTSSTMVTADGGTCVVGTADNTTGILPPPTEGCNGVDPSTYTLPSEPICGNTGVLTEVSNGVYVAQPGKYNSTFPPVNNGTIKLTKGVYCLNDGMNVNAQMTITTDWDNDGPDNATEGAFFFVPNGDITFNGGATVTLHAIGSSTNPDFKPEWINLLFYVPPYNEADIEISGNSGSSFIGTILATTSHVHLLGNGGTVSLDSQIISDTVKISGSTDFNLTYTEENNATAITNPGIELIK
jgi:hypothetical protein